MRTLSKKYYLYILNLLENFGLDREDAAIFSPCASESDENVQSRLEIEELYRLFTFAQSKLNRTHIGLDVSDNFRISNYGYAGSIYAMCGTLEQAMFFARKYGCLAHTLGKFEPWAEICEASQTKKYVWNPSFSSGDEERYKQITECILSNYVLTVNWLSWSFPQGVKKLSLKHSPEKPVDKLGQVLKCDVEFNAHEYSILLDADTVDLPLPTANPIKLSLLEQHLNQRLANYNLVNDTVSRVKFAIHEMMDHQKPTLSEIAKVLFVSERTLRRHLKSADVHFQDLLKSVKMELCQSYMQEGVRYSEIAQRLWYYDQSALTRAYKQWYGSSPSQHKKLMAEL